jgi:hypothetical protein
MDSRRRWLLTANDAFHFSLLPSPNTILKAERTAHRQIAEPLTLHKRVAQEKKR